MSLSLGKRKSLGKLGIQGIRPQKQVRTMLTCLWGEKNVFGARRKKALHEMDVEGGR